MCSPLKEILFEKHYSAYSELGYKNFEFFTSWAKSALDTKTDPEIYLKKAQNVGMSFSSFHLPVILFLKSNGRDAQDKQDFSLCFEKLFQAYCTLFLRNTIKVMACLSIGRFESQAKSFLKLQI